MNFLSKFDISKITLNLNYIIFTIILLSWAHQWLSIGSFINTTYKGFTLDSILDYRNQSISIFAINLFIFIFNKKKKIKTSIYFYLIPITYLLGLVNLLIDTPIHKNIDFFYHLTFVLQMINTLLILNNFSKIYGVDAAILLKANLLLIFIYVVVIFSTYDFNYYGIKYNINYVNLNITTNTNGISRIFSMLGIFITCLYFIKKKIIYLLLIFIINLFIIKMESRQGLGLTILHLLIIIIFYSQNNGLIKKIIQYFFLLIFIPLGLNFFLNGKIQENRLFMFQGDMKSNNVIKDSTIIEPKLDNFIGPKVDDFNAFTTGRLDKWKIASTHIIKSKIKNILFGNGPQFDRKIGDDLNRGDVANGILYVFLCGGLLGVFSFFLIIKKFLKIILYTFDNKKKLQADVYLCFSICCIISLTLRSLIENGYFVYGVDFLLITSSIFYLIKKLKLI